MWCDKWVQFQRNMPPASASVYTVPKKYWYPSTKLQCVTSREAVIFTQKLQQYSVLNNLHQNLIKNIKLCGPICENPSLKAHHAMQEKIHYLYAQYSGKIKHCKLYSWNPAQTQLIKLSTYSNKSTHLILEISTVTDKSNICFLYKYGWYSLFMWQKLYRKKMKQN